MPIQKPQFNIWKFALPIIIILVIGLLFRSALQTVPAGHRGIRLEFGKAKESLGEGLHIITPFVNEIKLVDLRTQKYEADCDSATKDLQAVLSTVALNYHIIPNKALELYRDRGLIYRDTIIAPAIEESVKTATAKFTAEESITQRIQVKDLTKAELVKRLEPYGIKVEAISFVNFDFSPAYKQAIDRSTTLDQEINAERKELVRIQILADQQRTSAQGLADAKIMNAEADAKSIELQGKALRENPELVELKRVEQWDGALPQYMLGDNTMGLFNIPFSQ